MTILLLLLAVALLAGLLVDARRRLAAERVRHAREIRLARAGLIAAHEDTRYERRVAAGWRARVAELETFTLAVTPREPQGDADPTAVTTPNLRAVVVLRDGDCGLAKEPRTITRDEWARLAANGLFRRVGCWEFVLADDPAADAIAFCHESPDAAGRELHELRLRVADRRGPMTTQEDA